MKLRFCTKGVGGHAPTTCVQCSVNLHHSAPTRFEKSTPLYRPSNAELIYIPSKHDGSDPEAFWLQPVMAIKASVQPESGRIVYAGSDFQHPFQFHFSKEGMGHTVQNQP